MSPDQVTLEVRCCCRPQQLLGTIALPSVVTVRGRATLAVQLRCGDELTFMLRPELAEDRRWLCAHRYAMEPPPLVRTSRLTLAIAEWSEIGADDRRVTRPAFRAEDVPLEILRRVPGFTERGR